MRRFVGSDGNEQPTAVVARRRHGPPGRPHLQDRMSVHIGVDAD